jgi:hypothetical protein
MIKTRQESSSANLSQIRFLGIVTFCFSNILLRLQLSSSLSSFISPLESLSYDAKRDKHETSQGMCIRLIRNNTNQNQFFCTPDTTKNSATPC